jgi:integrase
MFEAARLIVVKADMSLICGQMDINTLARQMGTSIGMLEQHYRPMTATMAADSLA